MKKIVMLLAAVVMVNVAGAAIDYNWNFDDGTAMGWTAIGSGSAVTWIGMLPPPNEAFSNFALGMNNNGGGEHLKWEIQKEITPNAGYTLSFDYRAGGDGVFARVYAWDADWAYLGYQDVADGLAWGWAPTLNYNNGAWTHKQVALDAVNAKYVTVQLNHLPAWGETLFDNVSLTAIPEPATLVLLGLGATGLLRKKK